MWFTIFHSLSQTLSQSAIVSRQSLIILISSDRVQLIGDTGMQASVNWQNMVLTDNLIWNQDEKGLEDMSWTDLG